MILTLLNCHPQSRKAVDAKGKIEIKTCKVCNFTMTCETESDLRSWRFHTHSHVSEKRSSLFAVECHCPGVDLSNSNTKGRIHWSSSTNLNSKG